MRRPHSPKDTLKFLIIALLLLAIVDQVFFATGRPYIHHIKEEYAKEQEQSYSKEVEIQRIVTPSPKELEKVAQWLSFIPDMIQKIEPATNRNVPLSPKMPEGKKPKIVIIIDDLGIDVRRTKAAMNLPGPLTMAFLPYAKNTKSLAKKAIKKNHEILIHTPMEPLDPRHNSGAMTLHTAMNEKDFAAEFENILGSFQGYVGINNHMGSRLTQDPRAMNQLMAMLQKLDLFFVDSRTIDTSIAAKTAAAHGVPYAKRDVFLDHRPTPEFVQNALASVERIARQHGQAVAIGHPKDVTLAALKEWLPTLKKKGFVLAPASAVLKRPQTASPVLVQSPVRLPE